MVADRRGQRRRRDRDRHGDGRLVTQAEIIVAGRALMDEPGISLTIHEMADTEWGVVCAAREIARHVLKAAEVVREQAKRKDH